MLHSFRYPSKHQNPWPRGHKLYNSERSIFIIESLEPYTSHRAPDPGTLNFTVLVERLMLIIIMPTIWLIDVQQYRRCFNDCINFDGYSPILSGPKEGGGAWILKFYSLSPINAIYQIWLKFVQFYISINCAVMNKYLFSGKFDWIICIYVFLFIIYELCC